MIAQAKASPRLRMNLSIHQSLEDECHRMRNAHPTKDELFLLLQGEVKVAPYNDGWSVIGGRFLFKEYDYYRVDIPKGVWYNLEAMVSDSVIYEWKEKSFVPQWRCSRREC